MRGDSNVKKFEFSKGGYTFSFANPRWSKCTLIMDYKIIGVKENIKNDGYFYGSDFIPNKKAMMLHVEIDGKQIAGVVLPEDIAEEVTNLYNEMREKDLQERIIRDIHYRLNDMTSYGIYNGISQFDIAPIVTALKRELNTEVYISTREVARRLTHDQELKTMAEQTYTPFPERDNWTKEYKEIYRQNVANRTAGGYGIIPNKIIKDKSRTIIIAEHEKELNRKEAKEAKLAKIFELAKETGERQVISSWNEPCNEPKEECNMDICYNYAMPDGTTKIIRNHTW